MMANTNELPISESEREATQSLLEEISNFMGESLQFTDEWTGPKVRAHLSNVHCSLSFTSAGDTDTRHNLKCRLIANGINYGMTTTDFQHREPISLSVRQRVLQELDRHKLKDLRNEFLCTVPEDASPTSVEMAVAELKCSVRRSDLDHEADIIEGLNRCIA